jgi:hypothetical protein
MDGETSTASTKARSTAVWAEALKEPTRKRNAVRKGSHAVLKPMIGLARAILESI